MAVITTALTTTANLKSALNITVSTYDTKLEGIIAAVSTYIESITHRKLKARDYDGGSGTHSTTAVADEDYIYFDGQDAVVNDHGLGEFYCPQWPILKSTNGGVVVQLCPLSDRSSTGDTWDTTSLVEGDDYVVDYDNGVIRLLGGVFQPGVKNYRLKCTAGYKYGSAQPYVPEDLERLCIELCMQYYKENRNVQSESIGTWSRTFSQNADPIVEATLSKYRRIIL